MEHNEPKCKGWTLPRNTFTALLNAYLVSIARGHVDVGVRLLLTEKLLKIRLLNDLAAT